MDAGSLVQKDGYLEYKSHRANVGSAMVVRTIILPMSVSDIIKHPEDGCRNVGISGNSEENCRLPLHLLLELEEQEATSEVDGMLLIRMKQMTQAKKREFQNHHDIKVAAVKIEVTEEADAISEPTALAPLPAEQAPAEDSTAMRAEVGASSDSSCEEVEQQRSAKRIRTKKTTYRHSTFQYMTNMLKHRYKYTRTKSQPRTRAHHANNKHSLTLLG
jgi:hypothetical protein